MIKFYIELFLFATGLGMVVGGNNIDVKTVIGAAMIGLWYMLRFHPERWNNER